MFKVAIVALAALGMLALAVAVDVAPQEYAYGKKVNVEAYHKEWTLYETYEEDNVHPCAEKYEITGATTAYYSDLYDSAEKHVGMSFWSGIVVTWDECAHCKEYKATEEHDVRTNYQIVFEFDHGKGGQLTCLVNAFSIYSDEEVVMSVVGGTGPFQGAWGTVTWSTFVKDTKYKYDFDIWIPKLADHDYDYKDGYYYYKGEKKY